MTAFLDSNVILYLAQDDARKAGVTETLLTSGATISVQVLNEVAHVSRRRFRYEWAQTRSLIDHLLTFVRVVDLTLTVHRLGRDLAERWGLAVYDGMIVAAALEAECDTLYSEDMHHSLVIDGRLTIVNPFLAQAAR